MKRQFFSFNSSILLLFILAAFIIIKTVLVPHTPNVEKEANMVLAKITGENGEISLLSSNELDIQRLKMLDKMDYDEVKGILGINSDFCIYFEDSAGSIVKIDGINPSIGSDSIYINGKPCR